MFHYSSKALRKWRFVFRKTTMPNSKLLILRGIIFVLCLNIEFSEGIYGGQPAKGSETPWTILIITSSVRGGPGAGLCSGSLISFKIVLTAAHCVQNIRARGGSSYADMILRAGMTIDSKMQERKATYCVARRLRSPFYVGSHDIALIKADKPFETAYGVSPIDMSLDAFTPGQECIMAGHGKRPRKTGADSLAIILKMVVIGCTEEATGCSAGDIIGPEPMDICPLEEDGKGLCNGDSGSALVCNGLIYAVAHAISYRSNATTAEKRVPISESCGKSYVLSIYVGLHPYKNWIQKAVAKLEASSATRLHVRIRCSSWKIISTIVVLLPLITNSKP